MINLYQELILIEKNFITSGRNTVIHKVKKFDLLILNGDKNVVIVSHRGIGIYKGKIPEKRSIAKKAYQDIVDISSSELFSEEKTLLFVQALDGIEYKIDYSKEGTTSFIKIHQNHYM
tara:strand:+ start:1831 stop:2184 length:354 start_codon:yes stop_codon:yes gene_type:complete